MRAVSLDIFDVRMIGESSFYRLLMELLPAHPTMQAIEQKGIDLIDSKR